MDTVNILLALLGFLLRPGVLNTERFLQHQHHHVNSLLKYPPWHPKIRDHYNITKADTSFFLPCNIYISARFLLNYNLTFFHVILRNVLVSILKLLWSNQQLVFFKVKYHYQYFCIFSERYNKQNTQTYMETIHSQTVCLMTPDWQDVLLSLYFLFMCKHVCLCLCTCVCVGVCTCKACRMCWLQWSSGS